MLKGLLVFCLAIVSLLTDAQVNHDHCEVIRTEDVSYFEHWLNSKKNILAARREANVYKIPIVVHLLHTGEPIGQGYNFSEERVKTQIRTLNEDYRRKENTPGFNANPNSDDARIEFILAEIDPHGNPTDGIVRVDITSTHLPPSTGDLIQTCSEYSYWNPDQYLNVWSMDFGFHPAILLGKARFPITDLLGIPQDEQGADGVVINASNFGDGPTNSEPNYNMGRTLTHEIGHFMGLLHTWGGSCATYTDYCEDTPPTEIATNGCPLVSPVACDGRAVMIENYMDYSYDRCMNIFTLDQIGRMHTVLENSPRRKSLVTSPVLTVTEVHNKITQRINVYPNPTSGRLYISVDKKLIGQDMKVTAHTLLGKVLFKEIFTVAENATEIQIAGIEEKIIVLTVEIAQASSRRLIVIN